MHSWTDHVDMISHDISFTAVALSTAIHWSPNLGVPLSKTCASFKLKVCIGSLTSLPVQVDRKSMSGLSWSGAFKLVRNVSADDRQVVFASRGVFGTI